MDRPRPRTRLPALLTVALPLLGTPLAVAGLALLLGGGGAPHRGVPSVTVLAAVASALLDHLGVTGSYGR
ncbi:hypothetical protein [Kitasatospora sp. NPDC101183]|uniref:hypothetical protein n=1 Tax=Kitasatospora sp. NPDC101183 TaxID=3364100 RepID=UPI003809D91B